MIIKSYSIGDYLLVSRLLNGDTISWEESRVKLLSSRATNHASSIRKIVGNYDCIQNIQITTSGSYYEKYKLNPLFVNQFQKLKMQYENNPKFMNRLYARLEKIKQTGSVSGS